jgi:hypothetical protein
MYQVLDRGKPASEEGYPFLRGLGWVNYKFTSWVQAVAYARKWLGSMDCIPQGLENAPQDEYKIDYGYGNYLTIENCNKGLN